MLYRLATLASLASLWALSLSATGLVVVHGGQPRVAILAPADSDAEVRESLQDFWRVVRIMSGASVPIGFGELPEFARGLPVLRLETEPARFPIEREGEGFRLEVGPRGGVLSAAGSRGLSQGLYWIIGYKAGVRWFGPQAHHEEIPERADWELPAGVFEETPDYLSRDFYWMERGRAETVWERRNLMSARYAHQHNLNRIFPLVLWDREPELFGFRRDAIGRRPEGYFWQPDLVSETVVDHSAQVVTGWLRLRPDVAGVSLSINDSMRFDEGPGTASIVRPVRWFRGRPDYTDLVFGFMNAVAERVPKDVLGHRRLGAYAYYWVENAPSFPIHPSILPVLTADRFQYYDPEFAENDRELMRRWGASGARSLMLYEYLYGDAYWIPRHAPAAIAESLRKGYAAGARGYFAEVRHIAGLDGPKAWRTARQLWNPWLDERELDREFAVGMFGPEAGDAYLRWLGAAERAWMAQTGPARWIRGYHDEFQGAVMSDAAMAEMQAHLEDFQRGLAAAVEAGEPRAKLRMKRGQEVLDAFKLVKLVVDLDRSRNAIAKWIRGEGLSFQTDEERLQCGRELLGHHLALEEVSRKVFNELREQRQFVASPPWLWRSTPTVRLRAAMDGWLPPLESALNDNPGLVQARQPQGIEATQAEWFNLRVDAVPAGWSLDYRAAEGFVWRRLTDEEGGGWRVSGSDGARLVQRVPVTPGVRHRLAVEVRGRLTFGVQAAATLVFLDGQGRPLGELPTDRLELGDTKDWMRLVTEGVAPPGSVWAEIAFSVIGQPPERHADRPSEWVDVRSIGLHWTP